MQLHPSHFCQKKNAMRSFVKIEFQRVIFWINFCDHSYSMPCWLCPSDIRLWLGFLGSRRGWSPACFCHDSIWYFLGFFADHLIVLLWSDCEVHWLAQKQARPVCQSHQVRKLGMLNKESCCKACVCYSPRRVSTAFHPYASQKLWTVLAPLPQQLLDSEIRINQFFRL